jgi:hypothetical protein
LGPVQKDCARAFILGWASLASADRLQFLNAGWPGSPVAKANFDTGITRAYSFVSGTRGWTVLVGVVGDPAIQWGGGWHLVGAGASVPGVQVLEIAR